MSLDRAAVALVMFLLQWSTVTIVLQLEDRLGLPGRLLMQLLPTLPYGLLDVVTAEPLCPVDAAAFDSMPKLLMPGSEPALLDSDPPALPSRRR